MKVTYSFEDMMYTKAEERNRIRIIIEYICNKNSDTLANGGVNYQKFFDEIQELEHSLID